MFLYRTLISYNWVNNQCDQSASSLSAGGCRDRQHAYALIVPQSSHSVRLFCSALPGEMRQVWMKLTPSSISKTHKTSRTAPLSPRHNSDSFMMSLRAPCRVNHQINFIELSTDDRSVIAMRKATFPVTSTRTDVPIRYTGGVTQSSSQKKKKKKNSCSFTGHSGSW